MNDVIEHLSRLIGNQRAKELDELCAAYFIKTKVDPSKAVLIQHTDYSTGKTYYWFEKRRGRSRKEILENLKSQKPL